ncbi:unnamed protein product [Sympodiomycopsis kandeliae]
MRAITLVLMVTFNPALCATANPIGPFFERNITYQSPSKQVQGPGLSYDVDQVTDRIKRNSLAKRGLLIDPWDASMGPDDQHAYKGKVDWHHGVASGDAYSTSVILWTKVTAAEAARNDEAICVRYEVANDPRFNKLVDHNYAWTSSDVDFTLKVEAINLMPKTTYYYRFVSCHDHTQKSPMGKLKTTPEPNDEDVGKVTFAVFSCSNYPWGFFNAYAAAARSEDVDYVVHLGDYIYEYRGDGMGDNGHGDGRPYDRVPLPNKEIVTLSDYRTRHAQYKTDRGSQAMLSNKTLFAVWDDHELADNAWKGGTADSNDTAAGTLEGVTFTERKKHAVRAYFEYMPIRQVDTTDDLRIWRKFQFGNLIDMLMLDIRHHERDLTDLYYNTPQVAALSNDTQRSLMGGRQEAWLYHQLVNGQRQNKIWKMVAQQIIVTPLADGGPLFRVHYDAWDGYKQNRERMLTTIKDNGVQNVIFLAGDSHAFWANEVINLQSINDTDAYDPSTGRGSLAVEFGGTAVTSPFFSSRNLTIKEFTDEAKRLVSVNRPVQYSETRHRGFYTLTLTKEKAMATYCATPNVTIESHESFALAHFEVEVGSNRLSRPVNRGQKVPDGAVEAEIVDYERQRWNGTGWD